jgi:hypothetical protein|tara:strand:+ start:770 stop:955 length:186 start_codon:yes stop_codon:yes gene_type:complete
MEKLFIGLKMVLAFVLIMIGLYVMQEVYPGLLGAVGCIALGMAVFHSLLPKGEYGKSTRKA